MADTYYYANGQKIQLSARDGLIAVKFGSRTPASHIDQLTNGRQEVFEPAQDYPELQQGKLRLFRLTNGSARDKRAAREAVGIDSAVEHIGEVFTTERGEVLVMTDDIVVKFQPMMKMAEIQQILDTEGLQVVEKIEFDENTFVLRVTSSDRRANDVANGLIEGGKAVYAHPNFLQNLGQRAAEAYVLERPEVETQRHGVHTTDPRFADEWHLENTGQVAGGVAGTPGADARVTLAWQTTMGNPAVRLGVIDEGIDTTHADLNAPGKVIGPLDLTVTPPDANPVGSSHGTQVAGMAVAAANNAVAVSGVAPNCRLIPVRVGDPITAQVQMARGFVYAAEQGADVITCSLGPVGAWTMMDVLRVAIDYATSFGRNGRGCVYTQAVDNRANPVSIDQVSSYERAIAVSRTNNRDLYDGAAMGPELDICAPGVSVTMITNTTPTNPGTTVVSSGTSFATPLTAGVACLVLSVNPNLSWEEVRQVLLDSADKIDAGANPYIVAPPGLPPGTRNDRYGYGRVNAQRALAIAGAATNRDLYIRDNPTDDGSVPQPSYGFWDSPDIWVRNIDDGGTTHQDTIRGRDNFLYARISNRGSQASHPCWVTFYITSFASTEFRYPFDFKLDTSAAPGGGTPGRRRPVADFPAVGTYLVATERVQSVPASGNQIVKIRWPSGLIPPEVGWHPCLLVEVSPHDGPTSSGQYVWENNNIGQKNITIRNARPGERLTFPFRVGHPLGNGLKQTLVVNKLRAPKHMNVAFSTSKPELVTSIAEINNLLQPVVLRPDAPVLTHPVPGGLSAVTGRLPFKMTFLEEARVALNPAADRDDTESLVLTFAANSSLELGTERATAIESPQDDDAALYTAPTPTAPDRATAPFTLTTIANRPALLLNSALNQVSISLPSDKPEAYESSLTLDVPADAKAGDRYLFDVEQRNGHGVTVGGVRIAINVVG